MRQFLVFAFSLVLLFSGATASASEQCSSLFLVQNWEVSSRVQKNKFVTNRDLYEYREVLHADFMKSLTGLTPDQHWVDLGAGKANAQIDYIKSFSNHLSAAQTTAVAYKLDRWFSPPKFDGKLQIKEGAFEQQPTASWKKADLVTDVFGVISYTRDLQTSLQKVFDLMNVKGEFYIFTTNYHTSVRVSEKKSLSLMDFIATIEGLRVEGRFGTIKITKEIENVIVPRLELLKYVDDAPPTRAFVQSNSVP